MKNHRVSPLLRRAALVVAIAGLAFWASAGARIGWTQTSVVRVQRDEITGIDYPVRHPAFVAGIEVPLLSLAVAGVLAGLSFVSSRRAPAQV